MTDDTQICLLSTLNPLRSPVLWLHLRRQKQPGYPALKHNCANSITSGVLSLHLGCKVALRPHPFLLISGSCFSNKGVGSSNCPELLIVLWILSGSEQSHSIRDWEALGKMETTLHKASLRSIFLYLPTSLHLYNVSLGWRWYFGRICHTPQNSMSCVLIYDYSELCMTCKMCGLLKEA